jgi:hypothetical protein
MMNATYSTFKAVINLYFFYLAVKVINCVFYLAVKVINDANAKLWSAILRHVCRMIPAVFAFSVFLFWSAFDKIECPTKLIELMSCLIDTRRLADALRGNNSVTAPTLHLSCSDEDKLVLVQALAENEGLVTLDLNSRPITDEMWTVLWQSAARHPKLEKLVLPRRYPQYFRTTWRDGNTDAQKTLRMQAMVDALRINTVLHTIDLRRDDFDEEILDSTVYPLLLANRYRPRVGAIAGEEGPLRCKLLGRALALVSSNPSLIWMFLSGNANVRVGPTPPE